MRRELAGLTVHSPPGAWREPEAPYGSLRTHDWEGRASWSEIERSPGVYDFGDLDWLAAKCDREGRTFVHVLYGTPRFYASSDRPDPYGVPGRASMPANVAAWQRYVSACAGRYPARLMPIMEPWNECALFLEPCMGEAPDWGQAAILGQTAYEVRGDHAMTTPSFFDEGHLDAYLAQPGAKKCSAVSVHMYGHTMRTFPETLARYSAVLAKHRLKKKFILSEGGWQPASQTPGRDWEFGTLTAEQQGDAWESIARYLDTSGLGIGAYYYSADADPSSGVLPMNGHGGLVAAMRRMTKGMRLRASRDGAS